MKSWTKKREIRYSLAFHWPDASTDTQPRFPRHIRARRLLPAHTRQIRIFTLWFPELPWVACAQQISSYKQHPQLKANFCHNREDPTLLPRYLPSTASTQRQVVETGSSPTLALRRMPGCQRVRVFSRTACLKKQVVTNQTANTDRAPLAPHRWQLEEPPGRLFHDTSQSGFTRTADFTI